jgi:hypothetical protein
MRRPPRAASTEVAVASTTVSRDPDLVVTMTGSRTSVATRSASARRAAIDGTIPWCRARTCHAAVAAPSTIPSASNDAVGARRAATATAEPTAATTTATRGATSVHAAVDAQAPIAGAISR